MVYALIPLLPLIAFVVLGLGGHVIKERAHLIAVPAVVGSFLLSLMALNEVASGAILRIPLYTWANSGDLTITLGLFIDQLTVAMLLLVTIVSSLVHVYTIGYMHGEPGYARFFSNIALFTFSMLMLVMSDNFLQIFVPYILIMDCIQTRTNGNCVASLSVKKETFIFRVKPWILKRRVVGASKNRPDSSAMRQWNDYWVKVKYF